MKWALEGGSCQSHLCLSRDLKIGTPPVVRHTATVFRYEGTSTEPEFYVHVTLFVSGSMMQRSSQICISQVSLIGLRHAQLLEANLLAPP